MIYAGTTLFLGTLNALKNKTSTKSSKNETRAKSIKQAIKPSEGEKKNHAVFYNFANLLNFEILGHFLKVKEINMYTWVHFGISLIICFCRYIIIMECR